MKKLFVGVLALLTFGLAQVSLAQQPAKVSGNKQTNPSAKKLTEEQKIEQLIGYVRNLNGATFIRNGSEYSSKAAAEHLQMKREKAGSRIKTARDFIEQLASESSISGKQYQIRLKDGKTYFSRELLLKELQRLEK
jgi:hypothetical protein